MSVDVLASLAQQVTGRAQLEQAEERGWDMWLLLTVFVLIGLGLVMLYSASAVMASQRMAHHFHLVSNQLQKIVVGMGLMVVALKVDYRPQRVDFDALRAELEETYEGEIKDTDLMSAVMYPMVTSHAPIPCDS